MDENEIYEDEYEEEEYDNDDEVYEDGEPIGASGFGKAATAGALIGVGALGGIFLPKIWHKVKNIFSKSDKKSDESDSDKSEDKSEN